MKVSYNWLQDNFEHKLPSPEELKEKIVMHSFEVETLDEVDAIGKKDYLLDIKILPNRAHDCNAHLGIAREVGVLLDSPLRPLKRVEAAVSHNLPALKVVVDDAKLCPRYMGRYIKNIKVGDSPLWLRQRLSAIGQKSINNIVDIANYVMFQTGQPLHVFDADKISGSGIRVRLATAGEKMTTLDGKPLTLESSMLVIADESDSLALAGIKGGMKAATTAETKNVILEAANFEAAPIRKTSQKAGIRTDASFRFEHELAPELAALGMDELTRLILELAGGDDTEVGPITDVFQHPRELEQIGFELSDVEKVLGIPMDKDTVEGLLGRFKSHAKFDWEKDGGRYTVLVPSERLDITIKEDVIEELGRINGYDKIPSVPLTIVPSGPVNKIRYYSELIRDVFVSEGFSEVYNYTLVSGGTSGQTIELRNPLSEEKKYLRTNLCEELFKKLEHNIHNKDLLGVDQIRIFEIGHVFPSYNTDTEQVHCAFTIEALGKKYDLKAELERIMEILKKVSGVTELVIIPDVASQGSGILEFNLTKSVENLPVPDMYPEGLYTPADAIYKAISPFPFAPRDIAVFVPTHIKSEEVLDIIKENAGNSLVKYRLFDTFTKKFEDGTSKTSYAFRLVFQANDRTLTGEEVNAIMDKITNILNSNEGWKVR